MPRATHKKLTYIIFFGKTTDFDLIEFDYRQFRTELMSVKTNENYADRQKMVQNSQIFAMISVDIKICVGVQLHLFLAILHELLQQKVFLDRILSNFAIYSIAVKILWNF